MTSPGVQTQLTEDDRLQREIWMRQAPVLLGEYEALRELYDAQRDEANKYRIEADCAMRDYDDLELSANEAVEALEKIATARPNKPFDPWARELARLAVLRYRASTEKQP